MDATAHWLAQCIGDGFKWVKSRKTLERRLGTQVHRIHLQSSQWNHTGEFAVVYPTIAVTDSVLSDWRETFPSPSVTPELDTPPVVYVTMLTNVLPGTSDVELSGLPIHPELQKMVMSASTFADVLKGPVLNFLALFDTPGNLADHASDEWLRVAKAPIVEWALAKGDTDAAAVLMRRIVALLLRHNELWQDRVSDFRRGYELTALPNESKRIPLEGTESLGWIAGSPAS